MFEIDRKKFGAFVSQLRKEKGYTQKELADRLYLSDKAISKWETAASIPDTALLIPLSELLGVSVTELLLCERKPQQETLDTEQVETIVRTAIAYSDETPSRAYQVKGKWMILYVLSILVGCVGLLLCHLIGYISETTRLAAVLGIVFGGYFCLFVRSKLPNYYDENRIGGVLDGPFRMNVPGVTFNNSNWPYIVLVGRIWACLTISLYPLISALMMYLLAQKWLQYELYVYLLSALGGLFIPVIVVGKKYQ